MLRENMLEIIVKLFKTACLVEYKRNFAGKRDMTS